MSKPVNEEQRARAQRAYDEGWYANEASDWGWSVITGHCGGCGRHDCHEGVCTPEGPWHYCSQCPERKPRTTPAAPETATFFFGAGSTAHWVEP